MTYHQMGGVKVLKIIDIMKLKYRIVIVKVLRTIKILSEDNIFYIGGS